MAITRIKPRLWWPGINRQDSLAQTFLGFWPFWERAGGQVSDLIANAHATNSGGVWTPSGMVFTGTNDRATVPTTEFPVTGMSLIFRVRFFDDSNFQAGAYGPSSSEGWALFGGSGRWTFRVEYSPGNYIGRREATDFSGDFVGVWLNLVVTVKPGATASSHLAIYRNGVRSDMADNAGNPFQTAGVLELGSPGGLGAHETEIGYCGICDRVLSVSEIISLHEAPFQFFTRKKREALTGGGPAPPSDGVPKLVNRGLVNAGPLSGLVA